MDQGNLICGIRLSLYEMRELLLKQLDLTTTRLMLWNHICVCVCVCERILGDNSDAIGDCAACVMYSSLLLPTHNPSYLQRKVLL